MAFDSFKNLDADDIFISYSREDGEAYLTGLDAALSNLGFSCFTDKRGTDANPLPPATLFKKIRLCKTLVLLATPGALREPKHIEPEVREFAAANGTSRIICVCFDRGSSLQDLSSTSWYEHVQGKARAREGLDALRTGEPSTSVVTEIEQASNYMKAKDRLRKNISRARVAFIGLTFGAVGMAALAAYGYIESEKASNLAANKTEAANLATIRADEQEERANSEANNANVQSQIASNKNAEAITATNLASQMDRLAQEKTKLAANMTAEADKQKTNALIQKGIADKNMKEAKVQGTLADERRAEADALTYAANLKMADSLYRTYDIRNFKQTLEITSQREDRGLEWEYLNQLTEGLVSFRDVPREPIANMTFTPDGLYLLTLHKGTNQLLRWNLRTGLSEDIAKGDKVLDFVFSVDRRWLAYKATSENIVLRDLSSTAWERSVIPTTASDRVDFVSFSRDGERVVTISLAHSSKGIAVQHWNVKTKMRVGSPITRELGDVVEILKVSPIGQFVVSYGMYGDRDENPLTISLFDAELNSSYIWQERHGTMVRSTAMASNGNRVALLDSTANILVFDVETTTPPRELSKDLLAYGYLRDMGEKLALSQNGQLLALSFANGIRLVDLVKNEIVRDFPVDFNSRILKGDSTGGPIAISEDAGLLAVNVAFTEGFGNTVFSHEELLTLWSLNSDAEVFSFENEKPVSNCNGCKSVISEDGSKLVTQNNRGNWRVWDAFQKMEIISFSPPVLGEDQARSSGFSPNGNYFFTFLTASNGTVLENGNRLEIWNLATKKKIELVSEPKCVVTSNPIFSADEMNVAVLCKDGYIGVWNPESGVKRRDNIGTGLIDQVFLGLDLSKDGKHLSVGSILIGSELVFDFETGSPLPSMPEVSSLSSAFRVSSPNGQWVVDGDKSNGYFLQNTAIRSSKPTLLLEPKIFDRIKVRFSVDSEILNVYAESDELLYSPTYTAWAFTKHLMKMTHVALKDPERREAGIVSPLGRWFVQPTFDSKIQYWNTRTGVKTVLPQCSQNPTFSTKETRLITTCLDGTMKVWDLASGQDVLTVRAHNRPITKVSLSTDEKTLLTVSENGAKLFRVKM